MVLIASPGSGTVIVFETSSGVTILTTVFSLIGPVLKIGSEVVYSRHLILFVILF